MSVKERLTEYIKYKKIKQIDFTESIGKSKGFIAAMSKSVSLDVLKKISERYPDLNLIWLLLNKGEMIYENHPTIVNEESIIYRLENKEKELLHETISKQNSIIAKQNDIIDRLTIKLCPDDKKNVIC